jgi:hypothetical protein
MMRRTLSALLLATAAATLPAVEVIERRVGKVTYETVAADDVAVNAPADTLQGQPGRLFAILVAIDKYPGIPGGNLGLPVSDSRKMAAALQERFGVPPERITFLHNEQATREGIRRALNTMADTSTITPYDRLLFMFSGHGMTITMQNGEQVGFLVPHDARVDLDGSNPEAVLSTCLPMDEMRRMARFIPARQTLFLADCCYGGLASMRRDPENMPTLQAALSQRAIQIITAGSAKEEVLESPAWGASAMTRLLLDLFNNPARPEWQDGLITAGEMGAYLKMEMPRLIQSVAPDRRQTPQFERMEGLGEFFLAAPGREPRLLPPKAAAPRQGDIGAAGLLFEIETRVPARAEITGSDFQNLVMRSFQDKKFRVFDPAALAAAMRAGDEAPTRFIVRGTAEYWLEPTTEDPFKLGRNASRARMQASLSVLDTYTGRVVIRPVDMSFNRLFYLTEDVRQAILEEVGPVAGDIATALAEYVAPPPANAEPLSAPVATIVFLEPSNNSAHDAPAAALAAAGVRPGLLAALGRTPGIAVVPEEKIAATLQAMGLGLTPTVPDARSAEFLRGSGARYALSMKYQQVGRRAIVMLKFRDTGRPAAIAPTERLQFDLEDTTADSAKVADAVARAVMEKFLPTVEVAR